MDAALSYLESTGQGDFASELPVADVRAATELAQSLPSSGVLTSRRAAAAMRRSAYTFPLDESYGREILSAVEDIVREAAEGIE